MVSCRYTNIIEIMIKFDNTCRQSDNEHKTDLMNNGAEVRLVTEWEAACT